MVDQAQQKGISLRELMQQNEDHWVEVINGALIEQGEMAMSAAGMTHVFIIDNLYDVLKSHVQQHKLGYVFTDGLTYILSQDQEGGVRQTRIPDLSFIHKDAMPKDYNWDYPFPGAPTLAVEVTSPQQTVNDMLERVHDYLKYGSQEVWVIYAKMGELYQYRAADLQTIRVYQANDLFKPSDVLPDLSFPIQQIFERPKLEG